MKTLVVAAAAPHCVLAATLAGSGGGGGSSSSSNVAKETSMFREVIDMGRTLLCDTPVRDACMSACWPACWVTTAMGDEQQKDILKKYKEYILGTALVCAGTGIANFLGNPHAKKVCGWCSTLLSGAGKMHGKVQETVNSAHGAVRNMLPTKKGETAEQKKGGSLRKAHNNLKQYPRTFGTAFGSVFGAIWCNCNETVRDMLF